MSASPRTEGETMNGATTGHRPTSRLAILAAALTVGACAGLQPPARSTPPPGSVAALDRMAMNPCNEAVTSVLAGSGIAVERIRGLAYGVDYDELSDRIVRYQAWASFADQPGQAVVLLDGGCRPYQIYTRGGARVPGVASY